MTSSSTSPRSDFPNHRKRPEILAPAGDMTCLQAALDAGADAVYLGLGELNMRQMATRNFTRETLPEASERCHARGVKLYLTVNTLIFQGEQGQVKDLLIFAKPYVDAVIVADWAVILLCRELKIPFHVSTQLSCANSATARFLKEQGAERVVLARECTLEEVSEIAHQVPIEIETFVHGAICVAVSGRCLLSHHAYGCSSNRGECHQPCRREYYIREVREGKGADAEFLVTPHTVLSAKDLCSLPFVDKLMEAGITSFKIEGRARNPEYVKAVVSAYREAEEAVLSDTFTDDLVQKLVARCERVYHRELGCGLFYGRPGKDQLTDTDQNQATTKKLYAGIVLNYYPRAKIAQVQIQDHALSVGDSISIHGPTSGVIDLKLGALRQDEQILTTVQRGEWATFSCPERVRPNDKVYLVIDVNVEKSK